MKKTDEQIKEFAIKYWRKPFITEDMMKGFIDGYKQCIKDLKKTKNGNK